MSRAPIARVLARLKRVRRSGNGYVGLCPANPDGHPSLSITAHNDRILLHCFRGCSLEAICDALGIRLSDLFECGADSAPRWTDAQRREYAWRIWRRSGAAPDT
jgi:hypothetical protein